MTTDSRPDLSPRLPRKILVCDLETRPDEFASLILGPAARCSNAHVREIAAASLLTINLDDDGDVIALELESFFRSEYEEQDIIANIDAAFGRALDAGGIVATYNGVSHDLPVLRVRLLRWWKLSGSRLAKMGEGDHLDLALWISQGGRRFPSLKDACAGIGLAIRPPVYLRSAGDDLPYEVMKCELDVLGTGALAIQWISTQLRDDAYLSRGMSSFGKEAAKLARSRPHLRSFSKAPSLVLAAPWSIASSENAH